jgi:hypothetical protein
MAGGRSAFCVFRAAGGFLDFRSDICFASAIFGSTRDIGAIAELQRSLADSSLAAPHS